MKRKLTGNHTIHVSAEVEVGDTVAGTVERVRHLERANHELRRKIHEAERVISVQRKGLEEAMPPTEAGGGASPNGATPMKPDSFRCLFFPIDRDTRHEGRRWWRRCGALSDEEAFSDLFMARGRFFIV